jgi:hypothetical protein
MSYTNAVFYLDYVNGNDGVRGTLSGVVFSNPSGDTVLGTKTAHGLVTGAVGTVSGCTQAYANSAWKVTKVDDDTFTLDGASWASFNGADVTGDMVPFGGQNWADAWKTLTSGATSARTAPGDTIKMAKSLAPTSTGQSAQWVRQTHQGKYLQSAVSITSSTNATPIVVTKAAHGLVNGDVVKIINHTVNTNANGIWVVANVTTDTFELAGSVGNGVGGATGTYQRGTPACVVLNTAVTQTIDNCEINWTPGTNVTSSNAQTTYYTEFLKAIAVITNSSHSAAGIVAKYGLPASLDLSGYQQISFMFRNQTSALAADGDMKLKLYSDTACTTEVESFDIPAQPATTMWFPVVSNKGSALSSTVQGVALYANIAMASKTFYIDNIVACKAAAAVDSLTHNSLISKNTTAMGALVDTGLDYASEGWYSIGSINGRIITLDTNTRSPLDSTYQGCYFGASETVALYKRETILTSMAASSSTAVQTINEAGADGNLKTIQGGYNTATGVRDGVTILDGRNKRGYGISQSVAYINLSGIACVRYYNGLNVSGAGGSIFEIVECSNNNGSGLSFSGSTTIDSDITVFNANMNGADNINISNARLSDLNVGSVSGGTGQGITIYPRGISSITKINRADGNMNSGVYLPDSSVIADATLDEIGEAMFNNSSGLSMSGSRWLIKEADDIAYNGQSGINFSAAFGNRILSTPDISNNGSYGIIHTAAQCQDNVIQSGVTSGNLNGGVQSGSASSGALFLNNFTINEATKVAMVSNIFPATVRMTNIGGDANAHGVWSYQGNLQSQTTVRHTASGIAWKLTVNGSLAQDGPNISYPIARVACSASNLVAVSLWVRRESTNMEIDLVCEGGQLPGISVDVIDSASAAIDTWEQLSISFTPTQAGVIELKVIARSLSASTVSGYFDDLSVSQA